MATPARPASVAPAAAQPARSGVVLVENIDDKDSEPPLWRAHDIALLKSRRDADGRKFKIVPDAVHTEPHFTTLFGEYNKYVLRRLAVWLDI